MRTELGSCDWRSRFGAWGIVLCASVLIGLALPGQSLARHRKAAVRPPASTPSAPGDEDQAEVAAQSAKLIGPFATACMIEPVSGTVIFDKEMHKPWPLASVTKMMLMLIVAEKLHDGSLNLKDQVTTSRKASKMGGSQVYLREGETFSLDDSMKAIVVHSANDSSSAVAEYIAGSNEAFVQLMNERAKALGLKDTHYYSVHGLPPAPGQEADVSSAYDSAILARELVKYPDVLRWSGLDSCPFRNGAFTLRNTNHLVRTLRGCDGLKTGFYNKAGFNVVATAHRNGLRLIAVVMGSPRKGQNFHEAEVMLSKGFIDYEMRTAAKKGSPVAQEVMVDNGGAMSSIKPVWAQDVAVFVKRGNKATLKIAYELPQSIEAPVKAGQQLGRGAVMLDGKPAGEAALLAPGDVPKASLFRRLIGKL